MGKLLARIFYVHKYKFFVENRQRSVNYKQEINYVNDRFENFTIFGLFNVVVKLANNLFQSNLTFSIFKSQFLIKNSHFLAK